MQEYMKHLKHLSTCFKAEQLKTRQLEKGIRERDERIRGIEEDLEQSRRQLKQLDIEKDSLQV